MSRLPPLLALSAALGSPLVPAYALDDSRAERPAAGSLERLDVGGPIVARGVVQVIDPGPVAAPSPLDLITAPPANGTYTSPTASLQAEPALGPFHGMAQDLTRAQSVRYFTARGDSNKGEYGTLLNMVAKAGFPTACARRRFYPEGGACLNDDGKMYRVKERSGAKTYYGTTATSGTGPLGTGSAIVDGGVTWRYEPNYAPGNGGKANLTVMTYQDADAGGAWTGAFAHQIAQGGNKKTAFTLELDMNNYWGDYAFGPAGPNATALQIFTGGPHRASAAIAVGQYTQPTDAASLVNAMTLCCATLASDNTILDNTGSHNGIANLGTHAGSAFTDGSGSAISFNSYGGAPVAFRSAGQKAVGLKIEGRYSEFQVEGVAWSVNPAGILTAARLNSPLATPASSKAPCQTGDWAHDTDFVYTCVAANTWKRAALSSW
ncbi:hypothetical protein SAMN02799631_05687 [Methylobacterium sp. 174MFSha1.1]|uniref:hypothetical protein n=1 Tax=Methylobacterium sp. 174MFSha1.1 TaxID=1502749 RepID=UPI0008EFED12|nr:hypothetical protein [Methylobacterium sp. 174MFSha1.1]SFV13446.1 hypothetical protein SAMN02799631_05687 [Methylobacterium sp. 174MFSha1.1]